MEWETEKWILCPGARNDKIDMSYYRKRFTAPEKGARLVARVSGMARYKLYLNGELVSLGPCKGGYYTAYETLDLSDKLLPGENVLAAQVLGLPQIHTNYTVDGPSSIPRGPFSCFFLDGEVTDEDGKILEDVTTDTTWKTFHEPAYEGLRAEFATYVNGNEKISQGYLWNFADPALDDSAWGNAELAFDAFLFAGSAPWGEIPIYALRERSIPPLVIEDAADFTILKSDLSGLVGKACKEIEIPANTTCFIEMGAEEMKSAYVQLETEGGAGSEMKIIYAEAYEQPDGKGGYDKRVRDDISGIIHGDYDLVTIADGMAYEPFWFRTFRFVRVEIKTTTALRIRRMQFKQTNYPLNVVADFESSDPTMRDLWKISLHTLKMCMHETYEDCPYYEQLQYIMDSKLETMFTYQVTDDDRLVRKCIEDFYQSRTPEGLLHSRFPSMQEQIIPGFSIYWILMVEEHLRYYGDKAFTRRYLTTIDQILRCFNNARGENGLVGDLGYWRYIDWVKDWLYGIPPTTEAIYSGMLCTALESAAFINRSLGYEEMAREYDEIAAGLRETVNRLCYRPEKGLYANGEKADSFSQQAQIWAVLGGIAQGGRARSVLETALTADIAKASYSMSTFLFRALEKSGLYHYTDELLDQWRNMAAMHCTTWPEDPYRQRSDCHAWGSLPIYEFCAVILGVRPIGLGYEKISIAPYLGKLTYAKGKVSTCRGVVSVDWKAENGQFTIAVAGPEGVEKVVTLPDGSVHTSCEASFNLSCGL